MLAPSVVIWQIHTISRMYVDQTLPVRPAPSRYSKLNQDNLTRITTDDERASSILDKATTLAMLNQPVPQQKQS